MFIENKYTFKTTKTFCFFIIKKKKDLDTVYLLFLLLVRQMSLPNQLKTTKSKFVVSIFKQEYSIHAVLKTVNNLF